MKNLTFEQAQEQLKKGVDVSRDGFKDKKHLSGITMVADKLYWKNKEGKRQGGVLLNNEDKEASDWFTIEEVPAPAPAPASKQSNAPAAPAASTASPEGK